MRRISFFVLFAWLLAWPASSQCGTQVISGYVTPSSLGIDAVNLVGQNFPSALAGAVSRGGQLWDDPGCNTNSGNAFPFFQPYNGQYTVTVTWDPGQQRNGACAEFNPSTRQVTVYGQTTYNGSTVDCLGHNPDAIAEAIAHELGHFLGLDNTPTYCYAGMMMSPYYYNYATGEYLHKTPSSTECDTANQINVTNTEQNPPLPDPFCEAYGCSPILVDLDGNNFHLGGLSDPVVFDINADGDGETIAWTRRDRLDAFLCLDLNDNGVIDHGGELFGNHTRLSDGSIAPDGYIALAEYDDPDLGGNGDGLIDPRDLVYGRLRLWIDADHDGFSDPVEIFTLGAGQIEWIGLDYSENRRRDQYGNSFRYLGRAGRSRENGTVQLIRTTDVFFRVKE